MYSTETKIKTNRAEDQKQEKIVNSFIYKYYLVKKFKDIKMVEDRENQLKGIDVFADGLKVDLKAQSGKTYLNNPTDTFCLELLCYTRTGEEMDGWFINKGLETTTYGFAWIPKATVNKDGLLESPEDIKTMDIMFVDRDRLKKYIYEKISADELYNLAKYMREKDLKWLYPPQVEGDMHLSCSLQLGEKPVNIICNKKFLKKFAIEHDIVTQSFVYKNTYKGQEYTV